MLTTDQKGAIAESAIVHAALKLEFEVYKPVAEGGRYDLIIEVAGRLFRVQCKWAARNGNVVIIRCYSCRRAREGLRKRVYTADEVDLIAAYCADVEACYLLTPEQFDGRSEFFLRLAPTGNNQQLRINWAEDFAFEARLRSLAGP